VKYHSNYCNPKDPLSYDWKKKKKKKNSRSRIPFIREVTIPNFIKYLIKIRLHSQLEQVTSWLGSFWEGEEMLLS